MCSLIKPTRGLCCIVGGSLHLYMDNQLSDHFCGVQEAKKGHLDPQMALLCARDPDRNYPQVISWRTMGSKPHVRFFKKGDFLRIEVPYKRSRGLLLWNGGLSTPVGRQSAVVWVLDPSTAEIMPLGPSKRAQKWKKTRWFNSTGEDMELSYITPQGPWNFSMSQNYGPSISST